MNKLIIKGHIGQDAVAHKISEDRVAISFNLAVDESYKDASGTKVPRTKWFKCTRFTKNESLLQYLKKGVEIILIGKAGSDAYVKDGNAMHSPTITIEEIEWIATRKEPFVPNHVAQAAAEVPANAITAPEDDLPF